MQIIQIRVMPLLLTLAVSQLVACQSQSLREQHAQQAPITTPAPQTPPTSSTATPPPAATTPERQDLNRMLENRQEKCFEIARAQQKALAQNDSKALAELSKKREKLCAY